MAKSIITSVSTIMVGLMKFGKMILILTLIYSCSGVKEVVRKNFSSTPKKEVSKPKTYFTQIKKHQSFKQLGEDQKKTFCQKVEKKFTKYGWGRSYCEKQSWLTLGNSVKGDPLVFMLWGDPDYKNNKKLDTTFVMCGVHGDEITPVKFCFDILNHFTAESLKTSEKQKLYKDKLVILAPLVSPDSFLKKWPTRTNANGIDVNRNFPTKDWDKDAISLWKKRYRSDKRRYPGKHSNSEPETVFQVTLISEFQPQKIISVHAPLTMLDYDGPAALHTGGIVGSRANQLLIQMSKSANGYRIKNYPFFPGSLGNYAGNERDIPTFTLELPTSDNRKHKKYWKKFKNAIVEAINHDLKKDVEVAKEDPKDPNERNIN